MEGVTILHTIHHTSVITGPNTGSDIAFTIAGIIFGVALLCAILAIIIDRPIRKWLMVIFEIGVILAVIGSIIGFTFMVVVGKGKKEWNSYEVSIDNTVNLSEFFEKYDLIERRENLFEIEERKPDKTVIDEYETLI